MRFHRVLPALVITALLASLAPLPAIGDEATKPLNKCPRHYSKHKDELRQTWCMDSSGRNYTPENARLVAKAGMKTKRNNTSKIDLAKPPGTINN